MNIETVTLCPTCGSRVKLGGSDDGTQFYIPMDSIDRVGFRSLCKRLVEALEDAEKAIKVFGVSGSNKSIDVIAEARKVLGEGKK